MKALYPELEAFASHTLATKSAHSVYFEEAGTRSGRPILFLHGGPGTGCNANHRRYFNPDKYRIILFDQRGCHRSSPNGLVENNTTSDILGDIESIRTALDIDSWIVFGGSWGATLALLYAEQYPENVSGLILRGSFLARQCDFDWFAKNGVNKIFPDYWREFVSIFSAAEQEDLVQSLHNSVFSDDKDRQSAAARAWALWAGRVVTHNFTDEYSLDETDLERLINETGIEIHYAKNRYFIKQNQILENIRQVPAVPITIIHGRRDLTCLPESSWSLHNTLPGSRLVMVEAAGHLAGEPAMTDALITATDNMAGLTA